MSRQECQCHGEAEVPVRSAVLGAIVGRTTFCRSAITTRLCHQEYSNRHFWVPKAPFSRKSIQCLPQRSCSPASPCSWLCHGTSGLRGMKTSHGDAPKSMEGKIP